jgi:hypothetical protein
MDLDDGRGIVERLLNVLSFLDNYYFEPVIACQKDSCLLRARSRCLRS